MPAQIAFSGKIDVLIVSWNCGNPCIESNTFLPRLVTMTMQVKLSSEQNDVRSILGDLHALTVHREVHVRFLRAGALPLTVRLCRSCKDWLLTAYVP